MPIYEYVCTKCGHEWDTIQKFSEKPLTTCPKCSKKSAKRKISAAAFHLKGSGWYVTDYKKDAGGDSSKKKDDGEASETKTEAKADTKAESKPADKAGDSKPASEKKEGGGAPSVSSSRTVRKTAPAKKAAKGSKGRR